MTVENNVKNKKIEGDHARKNFQHANINQTKISNIPKSVNSLKPSRPYNTTPLPIKNETIITNQMDFETPNDTPTRPRIPTPYQFQPKLI